MKLTAAIIVLATLAMGSGCNRVYFYETSKFAMGIEGRPDPSAPVSGHLAFKHRVAAVVPSNSVSTAKATKQVVEELYKNHMHCDLKEFGICLRLELSKQGLTLNPEKSSEVTEDIYTSLKSTSQKATASAAEIEQVKQKAAEYLDNFVADAVSVWSVFKLHLHDHPNNYTALEKATKAHRITIDSQFATGEAATTLVKLGKTAVKPTPPTPPPGN